ncbi:4Fe-4S ferredoxin [candidate division WOR-1 bacterium RIFCSPHIGHO2_01_FULL_53_15]|uniref:Ferredoxin n=1 Tax=candidate division WOR-1 bacterium RIFCSPHIGHO2_01_FULL_53_15 TaxID=1802564 RepID=A0A1F4Q2H4_UNCSA|nr:MAG: 4Fe-4S ferredoxin [candidate division WOR-1 bacterium RIFCSPHIGHO2_01_FULL_53_15]OGC13200.1 MAG: 4Fe-4S ferredoxin [candidate division WOR-1 bacterium RIFCSPHIGHO2_02_FULL_53_26]
MAISKVEIIDGCISCGVCEQTCPEVFEMPDIARVKAGVNFNQFEDKIKESAGACPVSVIIVE